MSDFDTRTGREHLGHLENTFNGIGNRPLTDGSSKQLQDISLSEALSLIKESVPYTTGEFKVVDADDFIPLFELVGLDMNQSFKQAVIGLNAAHSKAPSHVMPADVSDATQLLDHVLRVVAETSACHQDFDDTRLNIGTPEHIFSFCH